jgi:hypothetical protein
LKRRFIEFQVTVKLVALVAVPRAVLCRGKNWVGTLAEGWPGVKRWRYVWKKF